MAASPTYPGVYVQEVPSDVRTIVGVSTSIALFIGRATQGPINKPRRILSYPDFKRTYSDDATFSDLARHVRLFFLNGGTDCYVMRIANGAVQSSVTLKSEAGQPALQVTAKDAGVLGDTIRVAVTYSGQWPEATFNLEIFRWTLDSAGGRSKTEREVWTNLTMDPGSPNFAPDVMTQKSKLVDATDPNVVAAIDGSSISGRPVEHDPATGSTFRAAWAALIGAGATATSKLRISVDGRPYVDVDLSSIKVSDTTAVPGTTVADIETSLAGKIHDAVIAGLTGKGILGVDIGVDFAAGPTAATAGMATSLLRFTSKNKGDIRILSASANDCAAPLMLGEQNGGTEVGAQSPRRPAPTGITFDASTLANLVTFGGLAQTDVTMVTLDEYQPDGTLAPVDVKFDLQDSPARPRNFVDGSGGTNGVRQKLAKIRDKVNDYQATHPTTFRWKAELWGSRLAFIPLRGDDNLVIAFDTKTTSLAARFTKNVSYYTLGAGGVAGRQTPGAPGSDGAAPQTTDYDDAYVLIDREVDLFNLLILPKDHDPTAAALNKLWGPASVFCQQRRAFLIMDPEDDWADFRDASTGVDALRIGLVKDFSAIYFPRLNVVESGRQITVGAAGAMAGLYARVDANRGVWKAPAGVEADVRGVVGVDLKLSDAENGVINPVGVNAVRVFPDGVVSWGARTMDGADAFASEYKYIPIRRLALFVEESLYRGLKWVVFEPNDEPLWSQIRLNVGAFMQNLFRQGAFQGKTPSEAYFVKCDAETTTQNDRNLGIVNIWVGFAPLKPAEFVVIYLQQIAGAIQV